MSGNPREAASYLAEDILSNIELSNVTLTAVMLKCARLARLLKDEDRRKMFSYEAAGYPTGPNGVSPDVFEIARLAGRVVVQLNDDKSPVEKMTTYSVESFEQTIASNKAALGAAADPNVSISSANPTQIVWAPQGNAKERQNLLNSIHSATRNLARSRQLAYDYASAIQYEIEFSEAASSAFDKARQRIDLAIIDIAPSAAQKTASINENLQSDSPEDWANAVHGCRRLLQEIADVLFPPAEPRVRGGREIKLGRDQYINRLIAFIEDNAGSVRFQEIVGSTLSHMGERLDALFKAAQKGSHAEIRTREEAERYVLYTYMTVGDILALEVGSRGS